MADSAGKLAIVGASVRAAAFSAINAGFEVVAADLFADADLQTACPATRIKGYPTGLAEWLAATECDAWLYTGALENYPELVDRMAAIRPLLGVSGQALRRARDPLAVQAALADRGLSVPETRSDAAGLPLDGAWLAKTYRGSSGTGVWRLDGPAARDRAVRQHAVVQRVVAGTPAAAIFVVGATGGRLLGVTRQLVGELGASGKPFQYAGSVGPLAYSAAVARQLDQLGDALAGALSLRGLVGVDLVLAGDEAWVIEINPRYTASVEIVERHAAVSAIAAHVAACQGRQPPPPVDPPPSATESHGKAILFADRGVTISESFFHWAIEQSSIDPARRRLADVPPAGQQIAAGHPVLTVFASSSAGDCGQQLQSQLTAVRTRLTPDP